jgi:hypothetical protein
VEEIMNSINTAFKAISSIPVTGDSVDAMAVARAQLRKARKSERGGKCRWTWKLSTD